MNNNIISEIFIVVLILALISSAMLFLINLQTYNETIKIYDSIIERSLLKAQEKNRGTEVNSNQELPEYTSNNAIEEVNIKQTRQQENIRFQENEISEDKYINIYERENTEKRYDEKYENEVRDD